MADTDVITAVHAIANFPRVSWRGIPHPLTSIENGFTHDHVEHKWIYRDGMHVEATGRNGLNFLCRMPFNNGVRPAGHEGWEGQTLYPDLFRKMLAAVRDRSTGEYVHPDFGPIQCKARDVQWRYVGTLRDGAELSVRFYESLDNESDVDTFDATNVPERLDQEIVAAGPLPELVNDKKPFAVLMASFHAGSGSLGPVKSKLGVIDDALRRLDHVAFWPLRKATEEMRAAVVTLAQSVGGKERVYIVPFATSLPSIAIRLKVGTDDLVRRNPNLARDPYVPEGTKVIYVPINL